MTPIERYELIEECARVCDRLAEDAREDATFADDKRFLLYARKYEDGARKIRDTHALTPAKQCDDLIAKDAARYQYLKKAGAIIAWAHVGPWVYGDAIDAELDKWIAPK
jgi:hypothetical protein